MKKRNAKAKANKPKRTDAEIEAMMAQLDEPDPPPSTPSTPSTPTVQPIDAAPPADTTPTPTPNNQIGAGFIELNAAPEDRETVVAMQQLLNQHEEADLHRVEDPQLAKVLDEIRGIAHANIVDVFKSEEVMEYIGVNDKGEDIYNARVRMSVRDLDTLPREISAAIQSIEIKPTPHGDLIRVKMYDKQVALDKLMRFHGAFVRDNEQLRQQTEQHSIMDLLLSAIGTDGLPTISDNSA